MALVVVTGGARSGKSGAAERLAQVRTADGSSVVVAVFGRADDPEMADRIARHQADRPLGFTTLEVDRTDAWIERVDDGSLLLIDCLGTLLGLCIDRAFADLADFTEEDAQASAEGMLPAGVGEAADAHFSALVSAIAARAGDTIVVTNEVGSGVVPAFASGRLFRDLLGRANRALVDRSDAAYLCVAGRLLDLRRLPTEIHWPED
jgi:adenosyl cobinamide kinase/adenosyl cobinamide phosphate guanylyltransferase